MGQAFRVLFAEHDRIKSKLAEVSGHQENQNVTKFFQIPSHVASDGISFMFLNPRFYRKNQFYAPVKIYLNSVYQNKPSNVYTFWTIY